MPQVGWVEERDPRVLVGCLHGAGKSPSEGVQSSGFRVQNFGFGRLSNKVGSKVLNPEPFPLNPRPPNCISSPRFGYHNPLVAAQHGHFPEQGRRSGKVNRGKVSVPPLLLLLLVLTFLPTPLLAADSNWPTLHKDYQRSGYTDEIVKGPFERKWYRSFHEEMVGPRVEAIVAQGLCFVGTYAGNLYALNVADGTTAWTYRAGGPIGHSPCWHDGRLYVCSEPPAARDAVDDYNSGSLACLSAKDGKVIWKYTNQNLRGRPRRHVPCGRCGHRRAGMDLSDRRDDPQARVLLARRTADRFRLRRHARLLPLAGRQAAVEIGEAARAVDARRGPDRLGRQGRRADQPGEALPRGAPRRRQRGLQHPAEDPAGRP